jgi:hypothetical protein
MPSSNRATFAGAVTGAVLISGLHIWNLHKMHTDHTQSMAKIHAEHLERMARFQNQPKK